MAEPRTLREVFAACLMEAELELRSAQLALTVDDSDATRRRYATALALYDELQGQFPFVASGAADAQA